MLAFVTSFDEFIVAFFLTGTDATLPVYIWSQLRFPKELPSVMALGSLVIAGSILLVIGAERIGRRGVRDATATALPPRRQPRRNERTLNMLRQLLLATSLAAGLAASPARAEGPLTYFTWAGYELADFDKPFLAEHPGAVTASIFGDDDDAFTKVKAGFIRRRPSLLRQDRALAPGRSPSADRYCPHQELRHDLPVFRDLPDLAAGDGKVWMVPWDWGNTSILYRTDMIENPEKSWSLLWNPEYAGRIATIDAVHDTPLVAAVLAGVDPFDMDAAGLEKVGEKLREQRPLLSAYTTDMTSVEQSLASGALAAAMTWNASATALKKQGVPVEFMKPKEGMLTWACGFVLLKDSKNVDLAYDFINSRLDPSSGKALIEAYGYGASTKAAFDQVTPEKLQELSLPNDPNVVLKDTIFTGPMKQNDDLAKLFERVKAGG